MFGSERKLSSNYAHLLESISLLCILCVRRAAAIDHHEQGDEGVASGGVKV